MSVRTTIVRRRLAALVACSLVATVLPLSTVAEYGIPAGSGAVITAGQPILVRAAPGWDAEVSYEIADGSYVTVWDAPQAAPDGSMWYPVDGGFVPVDSVTSVATLEGGVSYYQDASSQAWVEPAAAEWTEPAAQGWVDPATGQWVEPTAEGWVDPATGQWVDAAATETGWVDPATGEWVEPVVASWSEPAATETTGTTGWVDPTTGQWVEPTASGWVDPATGQWVEPAATTQEWTEPASTEWVEPALVDAAASGDAWSEPIGTAYVSGTRGDGVACRVAAERGSDKLAVLDEGEEVEVRGEAIGEWQPVNCAGMGGYVNTAFISWELPATAEWEQRGRNKKRDDKGNNGTNAGNDGASSANGDQIANSAMQYVGYPYVYAGEGPYAFDCSGLTKFVVQNTLGLDITHDMFAQYDMGQRVSRDELQPGDLVFFQNTFRPGLSHNGIYIGGGQFVHAENEQTGVKVSDLDSDYYSSRWYGAVRFN